MESLHTLTESWFEEKQSADLYRTLSEHEQNPAFQKLFVHLAEEAENQALIWAGKMASIPPPYKSPLRVRIVKKLVGTFGIRGLKPILVAMKIRGLSVYSSVSIYHANPTDISEVGARHRGAGQSGSLRAAVFGVNDGLVSNASLIFGIAGAAATPQLILLSGIAGLLAGACSMAAGEYISMRSQREVFENQIRLEEAELKQYPEEEARELALIYAAKGIEKAEAERLANKLIQNPKKALETLAREELGLNPEELGSPWGAALFSFLAFAGGAIVPLLPFLISKGPHALAWSMGLTGSALFGIGALISLFTGKNAFFSGLRMLLIGSIAGGVTFLIGKLLGVSLS